MFQVYLGLGSNIESRFQHIQNGVDALSASFSVCQVSSLYETEPVEMNSGHYFYNLAVHLETELDPPHLIQTVSGLEKRLGRSPGTHMKDREIDIDILI